MERATGRAHAGTPADGYRRVAMILSDRLHQMLRAAAAERRISVSALAEEALDEHVGQGKEAKTENR